jgi:4-hydroxybenzoate polyprenyltransferase
VIGLVLVTVGLLALIATDASTPARWTLGVAMCFLACSFLIIGLDRVDHRFERERGDPTAEYQIVAKEGLELLGWSLVALALWDEALRRRRVARAVPTAPASRARAPSRRHAA